MTRSRERLIAAALIVVVAAIGGRARADDPLAARTARLAAHFYEKAQYYRAIGAYEELALFADDDATRRFALARIAMAYQHGEQLEDAIAAYDVALAAPGVDDTLGAGRIRGMATSDRAPAAQCRYGVAPRGGSLITLTFRPIGPRRSRCSELPC